MPVGAPHWARSTPRARSAAAAARPMGGSVERGSGRALGRAPTKAGCAPVAATGRSYSGMGGMPAGVPHWARSTPRARSAAAAARPMGGSVERGSGRALGRAPTKAGCAPVAATGRSYSGMGGMPVGAPHWARSTPRARSAAAAARPLVGSVERGYRSRAGARSYKGRVRSGRGHWPLLQRRGG